MDHGFAWRRKVVLQLKLLEYKHPDQAVSDPRWYELRDRIDVEDFCEVVEKELNGNRD